MATHKALEFSRPFSFVALLLTAALLALTPACVESTGGSAQEDEAQDDQDECALCAGKADGWSAPEDGTCGATSMLRVANETSFEELDIDAKLNRIAAENIVEERGAIGSFEILKQLDDVPYVGVKTLGAILEYAVVKGYVAECESTSGAFFELGIVSDLDKTVIPPSDPDLEEPPYPGVVKLYQILELREAGVAGDFHYVTARTPDKVVDVPEYLELYGVPAGGIDTGISGLPWVAQPEKVADITAILKATDPGQKFVFFGDSSHRDPEVYKEIKAAFPDRFAAGFIHKVNATVSEHRVDGLYLHESYAVVAATLYSLELIDREEARSVMLSAMDEGLAITEPDIDALLDAYTP